MILPLGWLGWNLSPQKDCFEALRLQIWSVERLHDQQHPFAQMETPLTTTDGHRFTDGIYHTSWLPKGRQWAFLHEVQVNIMVNIISIFKPFNYVVS